MPDDLANRFAIQELLACYCGCLDNGRFAEMAALFAEDGTWDTAFGVATSRKAIETLVSRLASRPQPRMLHLTSNVIIDIQGDTAHATSSWFVARNSDRGPIVDCAGNYIDDLRKVGGRWLFARRKIDRYIAIDLKPALPGDD